MLVCFALLLIIQKSAAQEEMPFQNGEELAYDIHFKYGLIAMKNGSATYRLTTTTYHQKPALKSLLYFRTSSFFDKVFKIRDTLAAYATIPHLKPLYHTRSVNEGSYSFREEIIYNKHQDSFTEVNIKRIKDERITIDTLVRIQNAGYDMLNIFLLARSFDYSRMKLNDSYNVSVFLGKSKLNIVIRYEGQAIIEKSQTLKYKTLLLSIDIADEVFIETTKAMLIWISDDENHVPLKLRASLKIGAAEAVLTSYKNLKYPLTSEIRIAPNP